MALWEDSALTIKNTKTASAQGSIVFKNKLKWKLIILAYAVERGYNTFYMDSDIVLFRNPFPYFDTLPDYDFLAQRDVQICSGFMFIRSTPDGKKLMKQSAYLGSRLHADDQEAMNAGVKQVPVKSLLLPQDLFPSGEIFFRHFQYAWDLQRSDESRADNGFYMFHNNYVRGSLNKELRLKEMGFFPHDINGVYSDPTARYITFERIHERTRERAASRIEDIHAELSAIVKVANELNRTLVIPPLRCPPSSKWSFCNMCFFEDITCFSSITSKLRHPFKESTFFTHEFVPSEMVKEDALNDIFDFSPDCVAEEEVRSSFPAHKSHHNKKRCVKCSKKIQDCVVQTGRSIQSSVYKVYSIA